MFGRKLVEAMKWIGTDGHDFYYTNGTGSGLGRAVGARSHGFLSSVTREVKREENFFILNNMPGKNDQNGTRRKREDCKSPSTEGSCTSPEAKRLNENQGSMSDLHKDMKEASAKHVQDPALAAIWETLVRIEANTNCLISEQKTLQRSYEELRESLEFTQSKMEEMAKNNSALKEQMKEMANTNIALQKRMTQLENDLEKKSEENAKFEKKLGEIFMQHDDLEQYTRKFNLEIHGIPEKSDEQPEEVVLGLAKLMEIDLTYDDIDITHRLNKGRKSPRPIIVRFSNYYSKEQMYRARWKLRKKSGLKGLEVDPKNIYINENLTAYRAGLFKKVRDRRQRDWKFWTTDGKIFVKPDPINDVIVKIQSEEDLNKL